MVSQKVEAFQGEMLQTVQSGELRQELPDTLLFSVCCPTARTNGALGDACHGEFAKTSHLAKVGGKMGQCGHVPHCVEFQFLNVPWLENTQDLLDGA